jgi:hypothetical protein
VLARTEDEGLHCRTVAADWPAVTAEVVQGAARTRRSFGPRRPDEAASGLGQPALVAEPAADLVALAEQRGSLAAVAACERDRRHADEGSRGGPLVAEFAQLGECFRV